MKKQCIVFGNCILSGIREFLKYSNFYDIYDIHQFANWELIKSDTLAIPIKLLQEADLVIYQPLSDVNGCYSTNRNNPESFFNLLRPDCMTISFPRTHNNAVFPIFRKHRNSNEIYGYFNNNVNSVDELLYLYDNNKLDYDFENRNSQNYQISKQKEENCDIKIADFIFDNLHAHKMFLTHDHPTTIVMNEITNEICKILDLEYQYHIVRNLDENVIGYQDSVYWREDRQYPISRYAIDFYKFQYVVEEHPDANEFYKYNTVQYFLHNKQK